MFLKCFGWRGIIISFVFLKVFLNFKNVFNFNSFLSLCVLVKIMFKAFGFLG